MLNTELSNTFRIFSKSHLNMVFIIMVLLLMIFYLRHFFQDPKRDFLMRRLLIILTIGQEIILNVYRIYMHQFNLETAIPLHLCSVAILISSYVLYSSNIKVFKKTYLIMFVGAIMAVLTPSIESGYGFPHFRFFQFFISHGLILINLFYIIFVMRFYRYFDYKDVWRNYVTLLGLFLIALATNLIVGGEANYMYAMRVPGKGTAFDLFGTHPWYLINIAIFVAPILLHILYLPMTLKKER